MLILLAAAAFARDVVHEGKPVTTPESFYVLEGPTTCGVTAVVGADGVPVDARADTCPDVLAPALREGALQWRWAPSSGTSTESLRVAVRPPQMTPASWSGGRCFAAVRIHDTEPMLVAPVDDRCGFQVTEATPVSTAGRRTDAWCAVDVVAGPEGIRSVAAGACAEGYEGAALAAVRSWSFRPKREQRWRLIVGFAAEDAPRG